MFGYLEPLDGTLDIGHTNDGDELRFSRVQLDMEDVEFTDENCMDVFFSHLNSQGRLRLIEEGSPEVANLLKTAEEEGPEIAQYLRKVFDEIGLLKATN